MNDEGRIVKRSVTVVVAGQRFRLKTDADEDYVGALVRYVSGKIEEARRDANTVSTQSLAILAALNIADDYFRSQRQEKDLRRAVREKSKSILDLLKKEERNQTETESNR